MRKEDSITKNMNDCSKMSIELKSTLLMRHLVLRKVQAMAEGDIARRIVTIIHRQFVGEPLLEIRQDLASYHPAEPHRHHFRDDEGEHHAHILRRTKETNGDKGIVDLDPRQPITVRGAVTR